MKTSINIYSVFFVVISLLIFNTSFQSLYAQKVKKNKVRLKVQYIKQIEGETYLEISASSRIKRKNVIVENIDLEIYYNSVGNGKSIIGKIKTNDSGKAKFILEDMAFIAPDSMGLYNMMVTFNGNEFFKRTKKKISFIDADIIVELLKKDSTNYIKATLIGSNGKAIEGETIDVYVQRLFRSLRVGSEFNKTDKDGNIEVAIENDIPGVNGNINIEVVLNDSDKYGTIKAILKVPIGVPIVEETIFDERTMWSSRDKTPIFLLIFPNLLILGVWGVISFLVFSLYKISKS